MRYSEMVGHTCFVFRLSVLIFFEDHTVVRQVGNASNQFSSAGPHNLYVLGQVHGCHFRTATSALGQT